MEEQRRQSGDKSVLITGAGPAGTSLAIRLARAGHGVELLEKEVFPRHKLCGEFISPECIEHFSELGIGQEILSAGGERIAQTVFYSLGGHQAEFPSAFFSNGSKGALGLSRSKMDDLLLRKAAAEGVIVHQGTTIKDLIIKNGRVVGARARGRSGKDLMMAADFFVDATGRARILSKIAHRKVGIEGSHRPGDWVAFKAHFKDVKMRPDRCEIYSFAGGYGGLNFVEDHFANHCFMIHGRVVREFRGDAEAVFRNIVMKNRRAAETMCGAKRQGKWIAVSVDRFGKGHLSPVKNLFTVGDSAAFIDPFTGSGMLMALQSSELLADCLGGINKSYETIRDQYAKSHAAKFAKRLRFCAAIRRMTASPFISGVAIKGLSGSRALTKLIARATRMERSSETV